MPRILAKLGFAPERARFLAEHIVVDPARGAGHALRRRRRGDYPHLRTRVGKDGMDYKGYNIAIHELGHNVEQVFSLYEVDHTLLAGVPNTAFTEALAFVFQARDLELLGLPPPDAEAEQRLRALNDFWMTLRDRRRGARRHRRLALDVRPPAGHAGGAARGHARASRSDSGTATTRRCSARRTCRSSAIYSHMISSFLYLPDYPLGHLIAFQIEEHLARRGERSAPSSSGWRGTARSRRTSG